MKTVRRLLMLSLCALCVGIAVNQFHTRGIRWQILLLSLPWASSQSGWAYMSTDSAFVAFLQHEAVFIDMRSADDYEIDHIPGALSLSFFEFFDRSSFVKHQDKNAKYILYDFERNSKPVRLMARQMAKYRFQSVSVLRGGLSEWLYRSFPVEQGSTR
jgi:rhodanese-related sulfurtransferase